LSVMSLWQCLHPSEQRQEFSKSVVFTEEVLEGYGADFSINHWLLNLNVN
jgi:hypothetical protein